MLSTHSMMAPVGARNIHGASPRKRRASLMSRPQLGCGGWVPKPRKLSEAVRAGAAVKIGCDHTNYPAHVSVPAETLASLAGDLR